MATVETGYLQTAREQLQSRRERLGSVLEEHPTEQLNQLLNQVDQALQRIDNGSFGLCAVCHDTVEADRLMRDPLVSVCLGCLSPTQQRALEYDLELAARIQNGLLPSPDLAIPGWQVAYHYRPAGVVGGDYCDVISDGKGGAYFLIADVAGKGVPMQYATVVFGYSSPGGKLQLVNAGHLPALVVRGNQVTRMESQGLPLGLFCDQQFPATTANLRLGDMVVLYTDGVTEAQDARGQEYGVGKLQSLFADGSLTCPEQVVEACRGCLQEFRGGTERADDETLLAIQFVGVGPQLVV